MPQEHQQPDQEEHQEEHQQQLSGTDAGCCDKSDASCSSSCSSLSSRQWPGKSLYRYEAKRAGGVYEQMMRVVRAGNNSNKLSSIRDVQVHKSQSGQNTRVETELQPTGSSADLNINIIMDSDSNLSNAVAHPSIEYESLDQTGASDEGSTITTMGNGASEPGTGNTGAGSGNFDPNAGFGGSAESQDDSNGQPASPGSFAKTSDDEHQQSSSLTSSREDGGGGGGGGGSGSGSSGSSKSGKSGKGGKGEDVGAFSEATRKVSDSSSESQEEAPPAGKGDSGQKENEVDEGDEEDEEGGEGEEGNVDDAQRHFQRYLDGEKIEALRGPGKEGEDAKEMKKTLQVGHLEKEGVVIGCMSVFADVHIKEYIVFLSDEMIQAFLVDPGRFRSVANRTKCEIEVTRRILNRRMGRYRWLKYLIVDIRGPSYSAIDQCDKMMIMLFPPYKGRKPYGAPAVVSLFLKETTPDNTDLYFNFQRTGPAQRMYGEIPLRAPFRTTKARPLENTPWKSKIMRQQSGILEPKNDRMETVMSHVYPERGGTFTNALDDSIKWAEAAEKAVIMSKAKDVAKALMLKARKLNSEPLYANAVGE